MTVVLLGLGYLSLAAAGAACWGMALAGSLRETEESRAARRTSLLVAIALVALAARAIIVWLLAQADPAFAQEKAFIGLPISLAASIVAAALWWLPRRPGPDSALRAAITAGAFAAATAAAAAEILLTVAVGAPAGWLAAAAAVALVAGSGVVTALIRSRGSGRARRPAWAAGAATIAALVAIGAIAFAGSVGEGSLEAAGFGPSAPHPHESVDATASETESVSALTAAPRRLRRHRRAHRGGAGSPAAAHRSSFRQVDRRLDIRCARRSRDRRTRGRHPVGSLVEPRRRCGRDRPLARLPRGERVRWRRGSDPGCCPSRASEFRAEIPMTQPGTYWYHTHQRGSEGVVRGLYGTLVVSPRPARAEDVDLTLPVHTFSGSVVLGDERRPGRAGRAPGDSVRLRLINTDQTPQTFAVQGAPFRVAPSMGWMSRPIHPQRPVPGRPGRRARRRRAGDARSSGPDRCRRRSRRRHRTRSARRRRRLAVVVSRVRL